MKPLTDEEGTEPDIGAMADELNMAWERFSRTLTKFRTPAKVVIPETGGRTLAWCRFGGDWRLIVGGGDASGGIEINRAALDLRIRASAVAGELYATLGAAMSQRIRDVEGAISLLEMTMRGVA